MYLITTFRTSFIVSLIEKCIQVKRVEGCLNVLLNVKTCTVEINESCQRVCGTQDSTFTKEDVMMGYISPTFAL